MKRRSFLAGLIPVPLIRPMLARASEPAEADWPSFRDVTAESKIAFHCDGSPTSQKYLIETMPGGVAMLDYDGDGRLDLFFVNGARLGDPQPADRPPDKSDPRYWNRLYHNNGDGTFTDVTEHAGLRGHSYGMGVAVGDYDNDGRPDIYVTNYGQNILYHNNGDGTFTDVTKKAGVAGGGWSSSACFVDFDRDGWLDLVVTRYLDWNIAQNPWCGPHESSGRAYCHPNQFRQMTHLAYRNNRDGTFTDVSKESGIGSAPGYGLGIAFNDYDRDGWPDIVIANDNRAEQLFHNLGKGRFEEVGLKQGVAYDEDGRSFSGMGVDFADYDNDGWPDIFIGSLGNEKYAVFHNEKGVFQYATGTTGVGRISILHSGWGLHFADFDNDGWKDLCIAQGHVMDNIERTMPALRYKEPLLMMKNERGAFNDVSSLSGPAFRVPLAARGVAFGDLNNDGFVDMAINVLNGPAIILRNGGNRNHWLMVNTIGTVSNRDGMGTQLRLVSESGLEQYAMVTTAGSYQSSSDKRVHFGLGRETRIELLELTWPSGIVQKLENPTADQILNVSEPKGTGL
jgi:hypothetical protein